MREDPLEELLPAMLGVRLYYLFSNPKGFITLASKKGMPTNGGTGHFLITSHCSVITHVIEIK